MEKGRNGKPLIEWVTRICRRCDKPFKTVMRNAMICRNCDKRLINLDKKPKC